MSPNHTDDQLILLKQLGFLYGWIQCHLHQPTVIGLVTRCDQCRKPLMQPPQRIFTYYRDRFPVHITPDEENQLLDAFEPSQMDDLSLHFLVIEIQEPYSEEE